MAVIETHINPQPKQRKVKDKDGEERIIVNTRSVSTHPNNSIAHQGRRGKIETSRSTRPKRRR